MSVIGSRIAVVSLGLSCQVTWQIRKHVRLLQDMTAEKELKSFKMYFDYIVTNKNSVHRFLSGKFPDFSTFSDLEIRNEVPYWVPESIWFEHNFRAGGRSTGPIDLIGGFEASCEKIKYLRSKFIELDNYKGHLLFAIGNSQKNLKGKAAELDHFKSAFLFDQAYVACLVDTLAGRYGERFGGLLVVESDLTYSGDWLVPGVKRGIVPPGTTWEGDDEAWAKMLCETVPDMLTQQRGEPPSIATSSN